MDRGSTGLTNGFTNGLSKGKEKAPVGKVNGCTNGLTNGLRRASKGMIAGPPEIRKKRPILKVLTAIFSVFVLIMTGIYFLVPDPVRDHNEPVRIDGSFSDWGEEDLKDSERYYYLRSEVECRDQGGELTVITVLIDSDLNSNTGYYFGEQGSDYLVSFSCDQERIHRQRSGIFQGREYASHDFAGFYNNGHSRIALSEGTIEISIPRFDVLHNKSDPLGRILLISSPSLGPPTIKILGESSIPKIRTLDDLETIDGITIEGSFSDWEELPDRIDGERTHLRIRTSLEGEVPVSRYDRRIPADPEETGSSGPATSPITPIRQKRLERDGRDRISIEWENGDILEIRGQGGYVSSSLLRSGDQELVIPASCSGEEVEIRLPRRSDNYTVKVLDWHGVDRSRSRTRTVLSLNLQDYGTRDVLGNDLYFYRDQATTETDCTFNNALSMIAGSTPRIITLDNIGDDACWYFQIGQNIPAGDWDTVVDLGETGGGQPSAVSIYLDIWDFGTHSLQDLVGVCVGITPQLEYQCLITGVPAKTLGLEDGIRMRINKDQGARDPQVWYNGAPPSDYDSRCSIPIPEFEDLVIPIMIAVIPVIMWSRRKYT